MDSNPVQQRGRRGRGEQAEQAEQAEQREQREQGEQREQREQREQAEQGEQGEQQGQQQTPVTHETTINDRGEGTDGDEDTEPLSNVLPELDVLSDDELNNILRNSRLSGTVPDDYDPLKDEAEIPENAALWSRDPVQSMAELKGDEIENIWSPEPAIDGRVDRG